MSWTHFWDMHSGGGLKEPPYDHIFIEAPEEEAKRVFYNVFGHNPERVSCTCCGEDYSVYEYEDLEKASEFHRRSSLLSGETISLEEFTSRDNCMVITDSDIKDSDREGDVPIQGYGWKE